MSCWNTNLVLVSFRLSVFYPVIPFLFKPLVLAAFESYERERRKLVVAVAVWSTKVLDVSYITSSSGVDENGMNLVCVIDICHVLL